MPSSFRTVLALAIALPVIACDKSGPDGESVGGTEFAGTEGDSSGATEGPEDPTDTGTGTEGASSTSSDDSATSTSTTSEGTSTTSAGGSTSVGTTSMGGSTSSSDPGDESCGPSDFGKSRTCEGGTQFCSTDYGHPDMKWFWGPCLESVECTPNVDFGDECTECELDSEGVPHWIDNCDTETSTPLVFNFAGAPVRYDSSAVAFDLGPQCGATDWPTAETPWLALDRDGSGAIESGRELFGSATRLRPGMLAENGFQALAELDRDRDGRITPADPDFARLMLWADHDADRRSTAWELTSVQAAGIIAIGVTYREDSRCDGRANCEIERAAFTFRNELGREQVGEIVDVHLACQ